MRLDPPEIKDWRPEHYVWYQTNGPHHAFVQEITCHLGNYYRCRIHFDGGACFHEFNEPTLSQAKRRTLLFFGEEEFVNKNYNHVRCTNERG